MFIYINKDTKTADYTVSLQAALNTKTSKPIKVVLGKGVYNITSIQINRPNTILFAKKNATIKFTDSDNSGIAIFADNCQITGINFIGTGISSSSFYKGFGVLLQGVDSCKITNNSFKKISGNSIFLYPKNGNIGCTNNMISGNNISEIVSTKEENFGILLGYSGENYMHNNNTISNNTIIGDDILRVGIGIVGHGNYNKILSNRISNVITYGILAYESVDIDTTLNYTTIKGNIVKNVGEVGDKKFSKGMGIYLQKSNYSLVEDNQVINVLRNSDQSETLPAGSISLNNSQNVDVINNKIDGSYMYGIATAYSFNSKIIGNRFDNIRKSGLYLISTSDVEVKSNVFYKTGELVIKGMFAHTSLDGIKSQMKSTKYTNLSTGRNIKIWQNKFFTDQDILYFTGNLNEKKNNYIEDNIFENNEIYNTRGKKAQDLVFFRTESSKGNKILNNLNKVKK